MNQERRKVGRPRMETYIDTAWYEIILQAGREGKHITDFLIKLGISWEGHYELLKRNKKYSEAFKEYNKLCEQWWFDKAHESIREDGGMGFNSRLWTIIMKNKFKDNWKEEKAIDVTTKGEKISEAKTINIEIIKNNND